MQRTELDPHIPSESSKREATEQNNIKLTLGTFWLILCAEERFCFPRDDSCRLLESKPQHILEDFCKYVGICLLEQIFTRTILPK